MQWVGNSQQRFDELFTIFLKGERQVRQRAFWPVSYCVKAHPVFIKNSFEKLLNNLSQPGLHNAIKRNTVRLLQYVDIPGKFQGKKNCLKNKPRFYIKNCYLTVNNITG